MNAHTHMNLKIRIGILIFYHSKHGFPIYSYIMES